jgi:uncharacterized integral membrane protein
MLSKRRTTRVESPASGVVPGTNTGPVSDGAPVATAQDVAATEGSAAAAEARETRRDRSRRKALRTRLHGYAIVTVALVAYLVALAASNTAHVKVNWVFGTSHVALIWLVLFAAILGWLLALIATAAFHWRTRAPRSRRRSSS